MIIVLFHFLIPYASDNRPHSVLLKYVPSIYYLIMDGRGLIKKNHDIPCFLFVNMLNYAPD